MAFAAAHQYATARELSVFVGTFNCGAVVPSSKDHVAEWLTAGEAHTADIYAIGLQEVVDLNARNNVAVSSKAFKEWTQKISTALGHDYVCLGHKHMVGLYLGLFVREEHSPHVIELAWDKVGVGVAGVGGNKGAVAARCRFYQSTYCFVNSHLAAHKENTDGRNSDWFQISSKLRFEPDLDEEFGDLRAPMRFHEQAAAAVAAAHPLNDLSMIDTVEASEASKLPKQTSGSGKLTIFTHDFLFWAGDLNYRINLDFATVHHLLGQDDIAELIKYDQLNQERRKQATFVGFSEGVLPFAPTYKYLPNTEKYDRGESGKKRVPAWCDRVLWRLSPKAIEQGAQVVQQWYRRSERPLTSDHRPVSALFRVPTRFRVQAKSKPETPPPPAVPLPPPMHELPPPNYPSNTAAAQRRRRKKTSMKEKERQWSQKEEEFERRVTELTRENARLILRQDNLLEQVEELKRHNALLSEQGLASPSSQQQQKTKDGELLSSLSQVMDDTVQQMSDRIRQLQTEVDLWKRRYQQAMRQQTRQHQRHQSQQIQHSQSEYDSDATSDREAPATPQRTPIRSLRTPETRRLSVPPSPGANPISAPSTPPVTGSNAPASPLVLGRTTPVQTHARNRSISLQIRKPPLKVRSVSASNVSVTSPLPPQRKSISFRASTSGASSASVSPPRPESQADQEDVNMQWREAHDASGRVYYYNLKTRKTQWQFPIGSNLTPPS